jgi:osmotically-inducible protein OsmY
VRHINSALYVPTILALTLTAGVACRNTADGAKRDAEQTADATATAREQAGELASDVQRTAAETAERASERVAAVAEGVDVKMALMADPSVDATRLNVNTDPRSRTIRLEGAVPTEAERDMAAIIAAGHAPGYRIENHLVVAAK